MLTCNSSECASPTIKSDSLKSEISEKSSPLLLPNRERYAERDSLYLDVGKPAFNGKIDTTSNESENNSLLIKNTSISQNSNSASTFAKNSTLSDQEAKSQAKNLKGFNRGAKNQSFLKVAIFNNMQKNSEFSTEIPEGFSRTRQDRRHTDLILPKPKLWASEEEEEPSAPSSDTEDTGSDDSRVGQKLEKINETSKKHPSKLIMGSGKPKFLVK